MGEMFLESREDYEEYLRNAGESVSNVDEYDRVLTEYLITFCMNGIDDVDLVSSSIKKLYNSLEPGNAWDTVFFEKILCSTGEGFLEKNENQVMDILYDSHYEIIKDTIERIHEMGSINFVCYQEWEFLIFAFIDSSDQVSDVKEALSNLGRDDIDLLFNEKDFIQSLIRVKKDFAKIARPDDYKGIAFDEIKGLDIGKYLSYNWKDKNVYGEEQDNIERIKSGDRNSIDAVIGAFELLSEYDLHQAFGSFDEVKEVLESGGVNIFETSAMDAFIQQYLNMRLFSLSEKINDDRIDKIVEEYVRVRASKENFNLFDQQGVSDLLQYQVIRSGSSENVSDYFQIVRDNMNGDMIEDYQKVIDEFIRSHDGKSVSIDEQVAFDNFLKALTIKKINNFGVMSQDEVDFIMTQNLRRDSIINDENEKYQCVIERAIEDLGKIDCMDRLGIDRPNVVYFIRDYINKKMEKGIFFEFGGDVVAIKRKGVENLIDSTEFGVTETLFHENSHVLQHSFFEQKKVNDLTEYNTVKEKGIEIISLDKKYYYQNYEYLYAEIGARETGAAKCANYFGKLVGELEKKSNVPPSLIDEYKGKIAEYGRKVALEKEKYDKAHYGKKNPRRIDYLNENLDSVENIFKDYASSLSPFTMEYLVRRCKPLLLEYNEDGSRKNIGEVMRFVDENGVNRELALGVIRESHIIRSEEDIQEIYQYIYENQGTENYGNSLEFARAVLHENLRDVIRESCFITSIKDIQDIIQWIQDDKGTEYQEICLENVRAILHENLEEFVANYLFGENSTERVVSEDKEFYVNIANLYNVLENVGFDFVSGDYEDVLVGFNIAKTQLILKDMYPDIERECGAMVPYVFPGDEKKNDVSYDDVKRVTDGIALEDVDHVADYEGKLEEHDKDDKDGVKK